MLRAAISASLTLTPLTYERPDGPCQYSAPVARHLAGRQAGESFAAALCGFGPSEGLGRTVMIALIAPPTLQGDQTFDAEICIIGAVAKIQPQPSSTADAAPPARDRPIAEQGRLERNFIKARHVPRRVDPTQQYRFKTFTRRIIRICRGHGVGSQSADEPSNSKFDSIRVHRFTPSIIVGPGGRRGKSPCPVPAGAAAGQC